MNSKKLLNWGIVIFIVGVAWLILSATKKMPSSFSSIGWSILAIIIGVIFVILSWLEHKIQERGK